MALPPRSRPLPPANACDPAVCGARLAGLCRPSFSAVLDDLKKAVLPFRDEIRDIGTLLNAPLERRLRNLCTAVTFKNRRKASSKKLKSGDEAAAAAERKAKIEAGNASLGISKHRSFKQNLKKQMHESRKARPTIAKSIKFHDERGGLADFLPAFDPMAACDDDEYQNMVDETNRMSAASVVVGREGSATSLMLEDDGGKGRESVVDTLVTDAVAAAVRRASSKLSMPTMLEEEQFPPAPERSQDTGVLPLPGDAGEDDPALPPRDASYLEMGGPKDGGGGEYAAFPVAVAEDIAAEVEDELGALELDYTMQLSADPRSSRTSRTSLAGGGKACKYKMVAVETHDAGAGRQSFTGLEQGGLVKRAMSSEMYHELSDSEGEEDEGGDDPVSMLDATGAPSFDPAAGDWNAEHAADLIGQLDEMEHQQEVDDLDGDSEDEGEGEAGDKTAIVPGHGEVHDVVPL